MARIRSLKPSVWTDERFIDLSRDARLLFIGMVSQADDDGRLVASGAALIGALFPHDDLSPKTVEKWRDEITATGLIQVYRHGRGTYAALPGWRKHQRIQKPQRSTLPPPPSQKPAPPPHPPDERRESENQSRTESRTDSTTEWEVEVEEEKEREVECATDVAARPPDENPSTTGRLLAEHLAGLDSPLPASVRADLERRVRKLLLAGSRPEHVAAGLAKLRRKQLSPRLLDQLVAESIPAAAPADLDPLAHPDARAFLAEQAGSAR